MSEKRPVHGKETNTPLKRVEEKRVGGRQKVRGWKERERE